MTGFILASITKALQTDQDEDPSALDEQRKAKLSEEHNSIIESYKALIRDQVSDNFFDFMQFEVINDIEKLLMSYQVILRKSSRSFEYFENKFLMIFDRIMVI